MPLQPPPQEPKKPNDFNADTESKWWGKYLTTEKKFWLF